MFQRKFAALNKYSINSYFRTSPGRLVSAGGEQRPAGLRHGRDLLHVHAVPLQDRPQLVLAGLLVLSHGNFGMKLFRI